MENYEQTARRLARERYPDDDISFDDDAPVAQASSRSCWVQAWVWVPDADFADDEDEEKARTILNPPGPDLDHHRER